MTEEALKKFIFSLSIAFPAIIGLIRFKKADPAYRPFLYYIFISLANELLVGFVLSHRSKSFQVLDWNLFNLFECLIWLVQFYYWQPFRNYKTMFKITVAAVMGGWLLENLVVSSVDKFNPVFVISYSFVLALLSISTINYVVIHQTRSLSKNAIFIICVALSIYFIYNIFVFTFLAMGALMGSMADIFEIRIYINALSNILFAIAIHFIPAKPAYENFFQKQKYDVP